MTGAAEQKDRPDSPDANSLSQPTHYCRSEFSMSDIIN